MRTYTIAYGDLLYACAPDGDATAIERELDDQREELRRAGQSMGEITRESGLVLTNDEPEDDDQIVWRGHDLGWLTDENGIVYNYAIRNR